MVAYKQMHAELVIFLEQLRLRSLEAAAVQIDSVDIPDEFLDPIAATLMEGTLFLFCLFWTCRGFIISLLFFEYFIMQIRVYCISPLAYFVIACSSVYYWNVQKQIL